MLKNDDNVDFTMEAVSKEEEKKQVLSPFFWMKLGAGLISLLYLGLFGVYYFYFRQPPPKEVIIKEVTVTAERNYDGILDKSTIITYLGSYEYLIESSVHTEYYGWIKSETKALFPPSYPIFTIDLYVGGGVGKELGGSYTISPTIGIGLNYKQHGVAILANIILPINGDPMGYNITGLYKYSWIIANVK